jgi:predicted RNA-binding protein with TRAM domain
MPSIPDSLRSLFSGEIEEHDGEYVVRLPASEIENGVLSAGSTYRVGVFDEASGTKNTETDAAPSTGRTRSTKPARGSTPPSPPVKEGERRVVEVESLGDQGDGIAKVERGYVLIVPGAEPGDSVEVEIEEVRQNVAFTRVVGEADTSTESATASAESADDASW